MKTRESLDTGKPFVVYENGGCVFYFFGCLFSIAFVLSLCNLLFPAIAVFSRKTALIATLVSGVLMVLAWLLGNKQPDSQDAIMTVSNLGIELSATALVDRTFIDWEHFQSADVHYSSPGRVPSLELTVLDDQRPGKTLTVGRGFSNSRYHPEYLEKVIRQYYDRYLEEKSEASN